MRFLCCFTLPLFIFFATSAQKPSVDEKTNALFDKYIQQALPVWKTPGMSVAVVKDGKIVFKKAYGVRELGKPDPYTTTTLSTCASTTKVMTAVCMGILVDEGKVKWSDKVQDLLPEFVLADPYSTTEITVLDLFTHNTGLGNGDNLWVFGYPRNEIIQRMHWMQPAYSLRASFIYQNLMYIVAGELIQKLSGKTWEEFITERIFTVLGMDNTFADHSMLTTASNASSSHFKDLDTVKVIPYLYGDNIGPAGGVWSCADDMARWLQCLLDSTKVNGKRLLRPSTYAAIFKPRVIAAETMYPTMQLIKPHWFTYGLGWFQHDYNGKMVEMHTGSLAGLTAIAGLLPDEHFGIYIFGNLDHAELRHALMYKAFDLWCFNDNGKDWSQKMYTLYTSISDTAKKKELDQIAKRVLNTRPSLPLTAYTGRFTNKTFASAEITMSNDALLIKLPNNININLRHWQFDTFRGNFNHWWMGNSMAQFSINEKAEVSAVSIDGIVYTR
jgi:CubicO group peptidase (beta-lactamase class C family)